MTIHPNLTGKLNNHILRPGYNDIISTRWETKLAT